MGRLAPWTECPLASWEPGEMARVFPVSRWIVRICVLGVLAVLSGLVLFSVTTQRHVGVLSDSSDQANRVSSIYQDARFWVAQEEFFEPSRFTKSSTALERQDLAEERLVADFRRLLHTDSSSAARAVVDRLLSLHAGYERASQTALRSVDAHNQAAARYVNTIIAPVFGTMQAIIYRNAELASTRALAKSAALRRSQNSATSAIIIAFVLGVALMLAFGLIIAQFRRRLDSANRVEAKRLAEIAITDPLTGLRNHRAFHEDLARNLHRVGRSGVPVSLIMLDLDGLKLVNDTLGHQAGDERIMALASAIRSTERGSDCAYRIGGDEFAVILDGTRAWNALEFAQRLNASLAATNGVSVSASAGISEALTFTEKDALIREADLALIAVKRSGQEVALYTAEMEPQVATADDANIEHHTRTLAKALALAVDAKDSYTRSHSQTVSQLCALIASQLGFDAKHQAQIRLAGLLHDVGKIGTPDAILNKPAKLTDDESEQMKSHPVLGQAIVFAADMPTEALWVRHHHERYDGYGYPDRLTSETIPLESRIIFVADSFEAMTSDRPYRRAPGQEFAIAELRRHAGTQFDPHVVDALCQALELSPNSANQSALIPIPESTLDLATHPSICR